MKLSKKVAIVTGGGSGIGEATVRRFVAEGAKVVVADITDRGAALCGELNEAGHEALFCRADVAQEGDIRHLIEQTVSRFGRLDIVVANAGIGQAAVPLEQTELDSWQQMIDTNLTGVFLTNKHAIVQMKRQQSGGAVVNVASILGHVGMAGATAYNAAKGGVANLTRSIGVACAQDGIRVNAVCPGFVDTPILDAAGEEKKARIAAMHPIGRLGRSEEIAAAILFLASDGASFMVGANLIVDGGYTAQ
ncbi:SDR family oxidoreductase (plasmid) [Cupriavidus sp. KK10]|jgi:NAD(P)-dependent dehydrogenase (short-subunit alcohol dehydrogenase family)|uniref:SDR family NAD(P)-dependent oxidoreductase n=1 Tax=Cupriavidus sp. KK10 TaxID=1478019 RepID=UPI001BA754AA|nr:SDR family NAD(P)-dependent oxidoreductase [Cupriavidus sp. KK10]QUN31632.1 SDR family oxidoreductase [Cupriavidus sp. KK10]